MIFACASDRGMGAPMDSLPGLTRKEASRYLRERWGIRRSPATLAKLATLGGGPRFMKVGSGVLYPIEHLDEFARSAMSGPYGSTSEYPRDMDNSNSRDRDDDGPSKNGDDG